MTSVALLLALARLLGSAPVVAAGKASERTKASEHKTVSFPLRTATALLPALFSVRATFTDVER